MAQSPWIAYRSLRFEHETHDADVQMSAVVNYTEIEVPFTRITEHKHFEMRPPGKTIITREYPQAHTPDNDPC